MLKRFCEIHRYDEGLPHKPCQGQDFVCLYDEVTIGSYPFFDLRKERFYGKDEKMVEDMLSRT